MYGTDSTKDVRARLIEILYDRVAYHKDKFIAPILLKEMEAMEVKKNGKVEHSDNSHDDQVFSYLMALYVWYEGKNLAENFHIIKNTLKTDAEEELIENEIEQYNEPRETVSIEEANLYDEDDKNSIHEDLEWIKAEMGKKSYEELKKEDYLRQLQLRNTILERDVKARESYAKERGLDPEMFAGNSYTYGGNITLDERLFLDEDFDQDGDVNISFNKVPVAGNLSNMWNNI